MKQEFDSVGRGYWRLDDLDRRKGSMSDHEAAVIDNEKRELATKDDANLLSSLCLSGFHRPVLDIDIPARYVPSSTEGHGHLYIDKALTWEQYEKLLTVLGEVGILEPGYVGAAIRRKATFVRPEWVKKPGVGTSRL